MSMTKCMTVLSSAKDEFLISTNFSQDPLSTSSFSFSVSASFENLLCDSKDTFKLKVKQKMNSDTFFFATSSSSTFVKCYAEWNHAYHISIGMNILFYLDEIKIDEVQTLSRRSNCKRLRNLSSATATGSFEDARDLQNVKCAAKLMCFGLARILILSDTAVWTN